MIQTIALIILLICVTIQFFIGIKFARDNEQLIKDNLELMRTNLELKKILRKDKYTDFDNIFKEKDCESIDK